MTEVSFSGTHKNLEGAFEIAGKDHHKDMQV